MYSILKAREKLFLRRTGKGLNNATKLKCLESDIKEIWILMIEIQPFCIRLQEVKSISDQEVNII